jgi:hypothetical protein
MNPLSNDQTAEFRRCLEAAKPIDALREIAVKLSKAGRKKREIYLTFLAFHMELEAEEKEDAAAILGDVMDMITDNYPPNNLGLPE